MRFSSGIPSALAALAASIPLVVAAGDGLPQKHEAGRCAMRGSCGKQGFFGSDLPCPDNGLAEEPEKAVRDRLISICGEKWSEGPVCCKEEQVRLSCRPHAVTSI